MFYRERFIYGISTRAPARGRGQVDGVVTSQGLELAEYEPLGDDRAGKVPFGGLALAVRRG